MANNTLLYKNVVGTYEEWKSTENAQTAISLIHVYDHSNGAELNLDNFLPNIYHYLMLAYRNSEIAFSNKSDFLDAFWLLAEMHIPNFIDRKNRYEQLLKLSDKDLLTLEENIDNFVEATDEVVENPLDSPLSQISNQNSSRRYGDKAARIRNQLFNMQATLITDFTNRFKNLFIRLTSRSIYYT